MVSRVSSLPVGSSLMVALCLAAAAAAQQPEQAAPPQITISTLDLLNQCVTCHDNGPGARTTQDTKFVTQFEARKARHDVHGLAYTLIDPQGTGPSNQLSRQICEALGIDVERFHQEWRCLSCHAAWNANDAEPPAVELLEFGVHCQVCHGDSRAWHSVHQIAASWRSLPPAEKQGRYGMVNLRDPVQRARQCYSCHIGDASAGRVVTHRMYAAGHPVLPGIELATFAQYMPCHWVAFDRKEEFQFRDDYVRKNFAYLLDEATGRLIHDPRDEQLGARAAMVGGVVAMEQSVQLFHDAAAAAVDGSAGARASIAWPDFALFDCTACHHELKRTAAGSALRSPGRPGRPQMHLWPGALVEAGIELARAERDAYRQRVSAVRSVLDQRPFGDPAGIVATAAPLAAWLEDLAAQLAATPFDARVAHRALAELCRAADGRFVDFHTARQIAWAIVRVHRDLDDAERQYDAAQFDVILEQLGAELRLQLRDLPEELMCETDGAPTAIVPAALPGDAATALLPWITEQRSESLRAVAGFDPQLFRERLAALRGILGERGAGE